MTTQRLNFDFELDEVLFKKILTKHDPALRDAYRLRNSKDALESAEQQRAIAVRALTTLAAYEAIADMFEFGDWDEDDD